ncbi:hypothetical protein DIPPA_06628 [Diplonema papillatum]|nr:hypothetical protein DIPPA_06628 [Diplonema papillatum]
MLVWIIAPDDVTKKKEAKTLGLRLRHELARSKVVILESRLDPRQLRAMNPRPDATFRLSRYSPAELRGLASALSSGTTKPPPATCICSTASSAFGSPQCSWCTISACLVPTQLYKWASRLEPTTASVLSLAYQLADRGGSSGVDDRLTTEDVVIHSAECTPSQPLLFAELAVSRAQRRRPPSAVSEGVCDEASVRAELNLVASAQNQFLKTAMRLPHERLGWKRALRQAEVAGYITSSTRGYQRVQPYPQIPEHTIGLESRDYLGKRRRRQ